MTKEQYEQLVNDVENAIEHIDEGEQLVGIIADEGDELAVTMEPEIRKGKKYYTFGFQGHVGDDDLTGVGYVALRKDLFYDVLKANGGARGLVDFVGEKFVESVELAIPNKEGVPAG